SPEEVVKVGDEIEVKVLRVDRGERKIGLSRKKAHWSKAGDEDEGEAPASAPTPSRPEPREPKELKGGLGGGGPLFGVGSGSSDGGDLNV
ncbi:MAG: S1 RNA-binding domain-containing protein, partial [Planctomycetaceae bacterium]|nr:S1 RNA-binding domain-containing protein [Planctomycetaceae bacterium]